jgi:NADH-quinone oxidoreductase subunit J
VSQLVVNSALELASGGGGVITGEAVTFWILGPIALLCAIGMVLARNAIHSALLLVVTMLCLGVFYMVQAGPFIGFVQIIVYTGAIMMLFLFVLMLVGRDSADSLVEVLRGQRVAAVLLGLGLAALVGTGAVRALHGISPVGLEQANVEGNVPGLARLIFTRYVFAFEVTSALLITAAIGAMVLTHLKRSRSAKVGQPELMLARFRSGQHPGAKAGPGVFATSNSVATPALLPDGTPCERSISPIVPVRELTPAEVADKGTQEVSPR